MVPYFGTVFIIVTFIFADIVVAEKCQSCVSRIELINKNNECKCQDKYYCESTPGTCKKCEGCFEIWDEILNVDKEKIEQVLLEAVEKYDHKTLAQLLKQISAASNATEKEFAKVDKTIREVDKNNKIIEGKSVDIKKELEKLESQLLALLSHNSSQNSNNTINSTVESIRDLQTRINKIFGSLPKIDANLWNLNKLHQMKDKLKKITEFISNSSEKIVFPNGTLNLAFATESDLNFLENLFMNAKNTNVTGDLGKYPVDLKLDLDIKNLVTLVFDRLNDYGNRSKYRIDEVLKNLTDLRSLANKTKSKLELNLERNETIVKIGELLDRYNAIQNRNKIFNSSSHSEKLSKLEAKFTEKYNKYLNASEQLRIKLKKIDKNKKILDQLFQESLMQWEQLKETQQYKSVDDLNEEIGGLIRKSEEYAEIIARFCDTNPTKTDTKTTQFPDVVVDNGKEQIENPSNNSKKIS